MRRTVSYPAITALALAACAPTPKPCPPPVPTIQVVKEKEAVPVACINKGDIPIEPGPTTKTGDARNDLDFAGAKIAALRLWGRTLVGMMDQCTR